MYFINGKKLYTVIFSVSCFVKGTGSASGIRRYQFDWVNTKRLSLLCMSKVTFEEDGKDFAIRTSYAGSYGKVFQAVEVVLLLALREI